MKHLKILGVAVVATAALMAFVAAGSAPATVLCSETKTPCPGGQLWPAKTNFYFNLKTSTVATLTNTSGGTLASCQAGKFKGEITKAGSGTETVAASIPHGELTWLACNAATKTEVDGTAEIHQIGGTDNGTVTASGFEVKTTLGLATCYYQLGTGAHLGAVIGGKDSVLAVNVGLTSNGEKSGLPCPATVKWTAEYTLIEPISGGAVTPLYVEPA